MSVYLDYNASSPIDIRVVETMIATYQNLTGNADSRTHEYGENARLSIENARESIAKLIGCKKDEVFFTSGATESNNIAILGLKKYGIATGKKHIITTSIEHKAVLEAAKSLEEDGFVVDFIAPNENGAVLVNDILNHITDKTLLVSVMHVNNETGSIQPVSELGSKLKELGILFHIDATQSCGKLVDEIKNLNYDIMSIGAHKMYGPQGIGALILRKKRYKLPPISPIMFGGPQEHGIRPGTLPTALIVGFGRAAEICAEEYKFDYNHCNQIKQALLSELKESGLAYCVNGDIESSVPNTLNVSLLGVSSEALMISTKQYCAISNGSACNSHSFTYSYVLKSMNLPKDRIESAIRISWGRGSDINLIISEFRSLLNFARKLV